MSIQAIVSTSSDTFNATTTAEITQAATLVTMDIGATWYGDPLEIGPDSSMNPSSNSAGLGSLLAKGTAVS